jgi:hypothetical protein
VSPDPVKNIRAGLLPVINRSGETLYYVSVAQARRLLKRGHVIGRGTKTTIRTLQLAPGFDDSKISTVQDYTGQHYSHDHDTKVNPEGCWTLKRLSKRDRPLFQRVQAECMAEWRACYAEAA